MIIGNLEKVIATARDQVLPRRPDDPGRGSRRGARRFIRFSLVHVVSSIGKMRLNLRKVNHFDFCDRLALRRLLPKHGDKFVDVCGGYGRLADEYSGKYKEAYLFDLAPNLLAQAKNTYGDRLKTVQGSVYDMPFDTGKFDALIMVRAALHLTDLNAAVKELNRILKDKGAAVIEIANKRNFFEILRWLFRRSAFRPFSMETESIHKTGFFWYHPRYVEQIFRQNGFNIKKVVGWLKWSPSIFYLLKKETA